MSYKFNHKKLNDNFYELQKLSILYFEGFVRDHENPILQENPYPEHTYLGEMVCLIEESLRDLLVVKTLTFFDKDPQSCSLINAYKQYSHLFDPKILRSVENKENESLKIFFGEEAYKAYENFKILRDKFIAHSDNTTIKGELFHKDFKILEIFIQEKIIHLANCICSDLIPCELDKSRKKVAQVFWNEVRKINHDPYAEIERTHGKRFTDNLKGSPKKD